MAQGASFLRIRENPLLPNLSFEIQDGVLEWQWVRCRVPLKQRNYSLDGHRTGVGEQRVEFAEDLSKLIYMGEESSQTTSVRSWIEEQDSLQVRVDRQVSVGE